MCTRAVGSHVPVTQQSFGSSQVLTVIFIEPHGAFFSDTPISHVTLEGSHKGDPRVRGGRTLDGGDRN